MGSPRPRPRLGWPWALALAVLLVIATAFALRAALSGDGPDGSGPVSAGCPSGADCAPATPYTVGGEPATLPQIVGRSAAVIEAPCGELLYGRDEHRRMAPASLTKIATALVAVEHADLSRMLDVRVNSALLVASTASTVMGLEPGMRLSLRDLLYGLLLASGNDAALAIASGVGGSVPAFVELMNDEAASLGLEDTHFTNPHGLDEPGLYTTAHDVALLGRALLDEPRLAAIVRTDRYQPSWDGPMVWNGNELLRRYPEALGVKIGYTEDAGQTIVAAAERDGRRLIVSVLGSWDRYSDAINLFEWAFARTAPACDDG